MSGKNKLFVKGERAAAISAIILFVLSVTKGVVALVSGSVSLLADSIHTFADIFSSIAVWVGLKLIQKKPTERFPYGYFKAESFALLIVSLTIIASGALILKEAVDKLFEPNVVIFPTLALIVAAISGVVSYLLGRYKRNAGRSAGSQSLVSEGQHSIVDVYTSLMVFIGVSLSSIGYPVAEALAGLAIGVYVIKIGLGFAKDAILVLMDACLSPERLKEIREMAIGTRGVNEVHDIRMRKSGPVSFGEMHLEMDESLPLEEAHIISDEIEEKIMKRFHDVELMTIHMGVSHKMRIKIAIPVFENKGLDSVASTHFGSVPFFFFVEVEKGQIISFYVKTNEAAKLDRKKGIAAAQFLVNEKVDVLLAGGLGESPFHLLRDNFVQIYHLPSQINVKIAVGLLNQNNLEKMTTPTQEQ